MKAALIYLLLAWVVLPFSKAAAEDFKCPEPTMQVANNIKGDLNGQAQTLIRLGSADLKGQFETTVVDLFSKYGNADKVAIAQNLLGPACNFLKSATDISGTEKFEKWLQIFPLVEKYFPSEKRSDASEPSAAFRSQYYNELAVNLSEFNFDAELVVEYLDKGWTEAAAMTPLLMEYNASITDLRKKEYVYLSWISGYWGKPKMSELSATYDAINTIDAAFHGLNDEFEAVNIMKTRAKVDPDKAKQALARLVPALKNLQESSKALLIDLQ